MMLGTCRTELTNQLGRTPGIFDMNEAQSKERLRSYLNEGDIEDAYRIFQASRPEANPSEVFFTIASARGYVRDQTIMAEQRVKAGGRGKTYVYRLMWRQPVEGGRRVSQHSLDLPFMFDNVAAGEHMTGPETESTRAMVDAMAGAWLAFARTGDPNTAATPRWAPYDFRRRTTMMFDAPCTPSTIPTRQNVSSWRAIQANRMAGWPCIGRRWTTRTDRRSRSVLACENRDRLVVFHASMSEKPPHKKPCWREGQIPAPIKRRQDVSSARNRPKRDALFQQAHRFQTSLPRLGRRRAAHTFWDFGSQVRRPWEALMPRQARHSVGAGDQRQARAMRPARRLRENAMECGILTTPGRAFSMDGWGGQDSLLASASFCFDRDCTLIHERD